MLEINKIYHGDCLDLMLQIPDSSVDCVICDLPYGTTACKWDIILPFEKLWENYNRICKENSAIILFGAEPFSSFLRLSNLKNYKYDWTWIKNRSGGAVTSSKKPLSCVENLSIFYREQPTYNPQMQERTAEELKKLSKNSVCKNSEENGVGFNNCYVQNRDNLKLKFPRRDLYFLTVFNRSLEKVDHPTQKPVALLEYLIKTYTNPGDLILDNCFGSGSTLVAARQTERNFLGIEKEEKYFQICKERLDL